MRAHIEARHDAAGLADLIARLARIAPPAELLVAIERPAGLIVDALLAEGHPVVAIHPNVVKTCRPRYRAADICRRARERGSRAGGRIRVLAWLRVLWRAWIDRTSYDPARHKAAETLARAA